nr:60S ribosomal protein L23A [Cryptomonas sp.]
MNEGIKIHMNNGNGILKRKKVRTLVKFYCPKTHIKESSPKYIRKLALPKSRYQFFRTIKHPITTESAMKKIQRENTISLVISLKSNKKNVKKAVEALYKTSVSKVNTLIQSNGEKKAYVKLTPDCDALDVANKIGFV